MLVSGFMNAAKTTILVLFLLTGAVGCQDKMEAISQITKFRVMAVQADPPQIRPGDTTTLRVLFADPKGEGRTVTIGWMILAGLFTPGSSLPDTTGIPGDAGVDEPDPLLWIPQLASAAEGGDAYVVPTFAEDIVPRIPEGEDQLKATAIVLLCAGGQLPEMTELPEISELSGLKELCVGGDGLVALKSLTITQTAPLGINPQIASLNFNEQQIQPIDQTDDGQKAVQEDPNIFVCEGQDGCRDTVPIESYLEPATVGQERSYISWFVTGGQFTADRSGTADESGAGPYKVEWLPPRKGGSFMLWAVAHDLAGGVSWRSYRIEAVANGG